jgi:hypothetical protein
VIQVAYEWRPEGRWRTDRTRIVAVVLFPIEVKRQLATLEAATARAIELARRKIQRALAMPPNLEALKCSVEVIEFDLRPFWDVATTLEDGTKVWLTEVERAHDCPSFPGRQARPNSP